MSTKQLLKVATSGVWQGGLKTSISIRSFEPFIVDEPKNLGGSDEGPNPVEFVLAGLSSCASVMIAFIAKEINFSYDAVAFSNSGEIDLRGLQGDEKISPHFQSVEFDVVFETAESEERIQELKSIVENRCPVINLLVDAGVPVKSNWYKK